MRKVFAFTLGFWMVGCVESPDFDPPQIIKTHRILAIVADPPEVAPGEEIRFTTLLVDPEGRQIRDPAAEGISLEWNACPRDDTAFALRGAQFDPRQEEQGCGIAALSEPLLTDGLLSATIDGEQTESTFRRITLFSGAAEDFLPQEVIQIITEDIGIPLSVEVVVRQGDTVVVRGIKRFMLTPREQRGTNPPPPRLMVNDTWVTAREVDNPFTCIPEDPSSQSVQLASDEQIDLIPDPDDASWLETYPILNIEGELVMNDENAFYSWFSTGGSLDQHDTKAPVRENKWATPKEPGTYPLFVVVRDGHGGTSACEVTVEVL